MLLKLKTESGHKILYDGIAPKEEIERQAMFGYTHIIFDNRSHFLNLSDDADRVWFTKRYNLDNYKWFRETKGNRNWVLYNPNHFTVDKNWEGNDILRFNTWIYKGRPVSMPINASTVCGMFSWMKLPPDVKFAHDFNLKGIKDTSLMFAGCIFPENFVLGDNFDMSTVENARYMFYKSNLTKGFSLGNFFNTSKVQNMEYMFSRAIISGDFSFGKYFSFENTVILHRFMYEANIYGKVDFGNLVINEGTDVTEMLDKIVMRGEEKSFPVAYNARITMT